MDAAIGSEAAWTLPAVPDAVGELRRRASAFAVAAGASEAVALNVALAVSETVTNVVIHAYAGDGGGTVGVTCRAVDRTVVVEVVDEGVGIGVRHDSPGAGQGLAIVGAVAQALDVEAGPDGRGTLVRMTFAEPATELGTDGAGGLEPLCALALDTVADVSCVDVVTDGVLRRAAAEVAGEPELTEWLRGALPPAKPGTATWAALRGGAARLVVHDPGVPRAPGGTGEVLDLTWWVSVPIAGADGRPAALWGLGGRAGGRGVPGQAVLDALSATGRTDLADAPRRDALRARLRG